MLCKRSQKTEMYDLIRGLGVCIKTGGRRFVATLGFLALTASWHTFFDCAKIAKHCVKIGESLRLPSVTSLGLCVV